MYMPIHTTRRSAWLASLLVISTFLPQTSNATIVEFQTVIGTFEVNLYDNATPATVANFLDYVNSGAYNNSIIHRSVPGFVIQGGGFTYDMGLPLDSVPTNAPVVNEPEFANVRGTIAMAKLAGDPDSATSQWFINLADNTANLDGQNGGFTVFGEVTSGMDVVDDIAALPRFDFGGATSELPLQNYDSTDFSNNVDPDDTHLVIFSGVTISDSTVDSAAGLNPPLNTSNQPPPPPAPAGGGGGGSFGILGLFALLLIPVARRRARVT
jgi:peptidyl-prolyl cis-trans isomerase A (cyclophilin A)